jgi:hypothetical protein
MKDRAEYWSTAAILAGRKAMLAEKVGAVLKPMAMGHIIDGFVYAAMREASKQCPNIARPISEWHEDMGEKLWWKFPIVESPYIGSPLDCIWATYEEFEGLFTHFTDIPYPTNIDRRGNLLT